MPVLRDSGDLGTPFGISVIALGAVGEFGPLLAISLFLSGRSPLVAAIVLAAVRASIAGIAIWFAAQRRRQAACIASITATLHTSGQFAVRLVIFVLLALVALSIVLDLDMLLGAFTAGVIFRLLLAGAPEARRRDRRVEARSRRLRIPRARLLHQHRRHLRPRRAGRRRAHARAAADRSSCCCSSCAASHRCSPHRPARAGATSVATALFGATGLPIIVAVTAIGVDRGRPRRPARRRRSSARACCRCCCSRSSRSPSGAPAVDRVGARDGRRRHARRGLSTRRRSAADQQAMAMLSDARSTSPPVAQRTEQVVSTHLVGSSNLSGGTSSVPIGPAVRVGAPR